MRIKISSYTLNKKLENGNVIYFGFSDCDTEVLFSAYNEMKNYAREHYMKEFHNDIYYSAVYYNASNGSYSPISNMRVDEQSILFAHLRNFEKKIIEQMFK